MFTTSKPSFLNDFLQLLSLFGGVFKGKKCLLLIDKPSFLIDIPLAAPFFGSRKILNLITTLNLKDFHLIPHVVSFLLFIPKLINRRIVLKSESVMARRVWSREHAGWSWTNPTGTHVCLNSWPTTIRKRLD